VIWALARRRRRELKIMEKFEIKKHYRVGKKSPFNALTTKVACYDLSVIHKNG
jgi:hypothetical protein